MRVVVTTTSVGARSSLLAASGPAASLSLTSDVGPHHVEAPRVREVVVGRPAGQLEQLVERLAVHRLRPVGLVRAAGADCLLQVHGTGKLVTRGSNVPASACA